MLLLLPNTVSLNCVLLQLCCASAPAGPWRTVVRLVIRNNRRTTLRARWPVQCAGHGIWCVFAVHSLSLFAVQHQRQRVILQQVKIAVVNKLVKVNQLW